MNIVVANNCQGAGFAAALARMTGLSQIGVVKLLATDGYDEVRARLGPRLTGCDTLLIHPGFEAHARRLSAELDLRQLHILTMPWVEFDAFHPDLTLSASRATGETFVAYQSAIGLWAFDRKIVPARAARLFCERTYGALGYFDRWASAVALQRRLFEGTFAEPVFEAFFLAAKRTGCFMHVPHHPKVGLLVDLARHAARTLGLKVRSPVHEGELVDALDIAVWPVYPEIAEAIGVREGGYGWRMNQGRMRIDGAQRFLSYSYRNMLSQGIRPGDLQRTGFPVQDFDQRMDRIAAEIL